MLERVASAGFEDLRIVRRSQAHADHKGPPDLLSARTLVERLLRSPLGAFELRRVLAELDPMHETISRAQDDELIEPLARLLQQGVIAAVPIARNTFVHDDVPAPKAEQAPVKEVKETTWVEFVLLDDATGDPVGDVKFDLTVPGKGKSTRTTPKSGSIDIDPCDPGVCAIEADLEGATVGNTLELLGTGTPDKTPLLGVPFPKPDGATMHLARVRRHPVRASDTLASIAESAGLTWQALAKFNFGTAAPDAINRALYVQVGCRKKTKDGKNYVFSNDDSPGIIYVPERARLSGLTTGQTHTFRVRRITRPLRPLLFSF
jgi:hypothetical protein